MKVYFSGLWNSIGWICSDRKWDLSEWVIQHGKTLELI